MAVQTKNLTLKDREKTCITLRAVWQIYCTEIRQKITGAKYSQFPVTQYLKLKFFQKAEKKTNFQGAATRCHHKSKIIAAVGEERVVP